MGESMDLVVGIDSSTTATKAIAWDRGGTAVAVGTAPVPMANPAPGWFEQDPADWWDAACAALRQVTAAVDPARIGALAIANQRETVAFLEADGRPVRPAITWLDERCRDDVAMLSHELGAERLRVLTGKTPDPTPALYSVHWLRRAEPAAFAATRHFVDVHGYLVRRLTGVAATAWPCADPHGFFDIADKRYAPEIMRHLGVSAEQFFPAHPSGTTLGTLTEAAALATGLRAGTKVAAGGGDGQAAGLGCAILDASRAYLNLGTAAVSGIFGPEPLTDAAFRTEISLTNDGYIYELVLRTGAFLTDWMVQRLLGFDPKADPGCYDRLEAEAEFLPPGSDGLMLLPYWGGVMCPWWDEAARGLMLGFAPEHGRGHVYRALIEGIALDMAMGYATVEQLTGAPIQELVAIGGGARSRLWRKIVADATGRTVCASQTIEATCLGAGMCAAVAAGWHATPAEAARAMQGAVRERLAPDPAAHARYRALLDIYRDLFPATQPAMRKLAAFRKGA